MQLDVQRYSHHLARFDLSDADQARVVEQLWLIAVSCVDRAWGDAPEQVLLGIGGTNCAARAHDKLDSIEPLTPAFNDADFEGPAGKRMP